MRTQAVAREGSCYLFIFAVILPACILDLGASPTPEPHRTIFSAHTVVEPSGCSGVSGKRGSCSPIRVARGDPTYPIVRPSLRNTTGMRSLIVRAMRGCQSLLLPPLLTSTQ
jgi:hypothetical protein